MKVYCSVFGSDCTNGGLTSGKDHILLDIDSNGGSDLDYRKDDDLVLSVAWNVLDARGLAKGGLGYLLAMREQAVAMYTKPPRVEVVRAFAYPRKGGPGMFGGHFVWTSDSRFPFHSPLPVFDRYE